MTVINIEAMVSSVWEEQGTDRNTGEVFKWYRALLTVPGEAPMQLAVAKDDFENLVLTQGQSGKCVLEIDARPGQRCKIYYKGLK